MSFASTATDRDRRIRRVEREEEAPLVGGGARVDCPGREEHPGPLHAPRAHAKTPGKADLREMLRAVLGCPGWGRTVKDRVDALPVRLAHVDQHLRGQRRAVLVVEGDPLRDQRLRFRPLEDARPAPAHPSDAVAHVLRPGQVVVECVPLQRPELCLGGAACARTLKSFQRPPAYFVQKNADQIRRAVSE